MGDRRSVFETYLEELVDQLSERPTIPAQLDEIAQQDDRAVDLPTKHCAFAGIEKTFSWSAGSAASRQAHDSFMLRIERE